jgi:Tfp pilus assembly protein FimT
MRHTLLVVALVAILVVAMAAPVFAGLQRGQNNTNRGFEENDFNSARSTGFFNGGDNRNRDDGLRVGDFRN